jgi:Flp pilus assembly protein TadG
LKQECLRTVRRIIGRAIRSDRGGAVIETALVFPMLFLLMSGMCEFGLFFINAITLTNAVTSAARFAMVNPTLYSSTNPPSANTIQGVIYYSGGSFLQGYDNSYITISYWTLNSSGTMTYCGKYSSTTGTLSPSSCATSGNLINVQATYTYYFFTGILNTMFPSGVTIKPTASMIETN